MLARERPNLYNLSVKTKAKRSAIEVAACEEAIGERICGLRVY